MAISDIGMDYFLDFSNGGALDSVSWILVICARCRDRSGFIGIASRHEGLQEKERVRPLNRGWSGPHFQATWRALTDRPRIPISPTGLDAGQKRFPWGEASVSVSLIIVNQRRPTACAETVGFRFMRVGKNTNSSIIVFFLDEGAG